MADIAIAGAETGDLGEIVIGGGPNLPDVSLWPGTGGNYCYRCLGGSTGNYSNVQIVPSPTLQAVSGSFRWRCENLAGSGTTAICVMRETNSTSPGLAIRISGGNLFGVIAVGGLTFTTTNAASGQIAEINTDYVFHWVVDAAAGGVVKLWIDKAGTGSVLEVDTTHSTAMAQITRLYWDGPSVSDGFHHYIDDIYLTDTTTKVVTNFNSRIIARHSKSGTPNVDTFTKTAGASIDTIWDDTPTDGGTTNAQSTAAGQGQTVLVSSFSSTQTGHGSETIQSGDTIHAAKVSAYMREIGSGTTRTYTLRRRVGGANTDIAKTLTASAAHYESAIFTATLTDLNAMEWGATRGSGTGKQVQVDDGWAHVLFTMNKTNRPRVVGQALNRGASF